MKKAPKAPDYWLHEKPGSWQYRAWYNDRYDEHQASLRTEAMIQRVVLIGLGILALGGILFVAL